MELNKKTLDEIFLAASELEREVPVAEESWTWHDLAVAANRCVHIAVTEDDKPDEQPDQRPT